MSVDPGWRGPYDRGMRMSITTLALVLVAACAQASGHSPDAAPGAGSDASLDAASSDARPATLASIGVTASPTSVPAGLTTQLTATGHYSDGSMRDLTASVTWASTADAVASVDGAGLVTTHAMGAATLTATLGTTTGTVELAVAAAAVASVAVGAPATSPLAKGLTVQLVATGTFTDGTMADVSTRATWATTNAAVATVTGGLVTAVAASGSADISATVDQHAGTATVTDAVAAAAAIAIGSGDVALAQHQRAKLHATLTFTDGTTQDATAAATWASDAAAVVSASGGVLDAKAQAGSAGITATASGFSATIHATVGATACHPVINEVQAAGASAGDEWVELYNPCTIAIDVGSWTIDYRAKTTVGAADTNALVTLAGTMQPGDLRLYAGPAFSGSVAALDGAQWGGANGLLAGDAGAIGLRSGPKDTGALVDAVAYGVVTAGNPFLEGTSAPGLATGKSVARARFAGDDTNSNGTDFALVAAPTAKQLNAP